MCLPDLDHHGLFLVVVPVHLQVLNDIVEEDSSATVPAHTVGHGHVHEMHMQVVKSGVVMEQTLDLATWKTESFWDRLVTGVTNTN